MAALSETKSNSSCTGHFGALKMTWGNETDFREFVSVFRRLLSTRLVGERLK